MSKFYINMKVCKLKHSKLAWTWLQIGPNRLRIGLRISVLDNHSNFTIKFTATYCNSAKHISYCLIRPSGMCTFCSLSGIFRANSIYNMTFTGALLLVMFLASEIFSPMETKLYLWLCWWLCWWQHTPSPTSVTNMDVASKSERITTHWYFILSISSNFDKNVNFLNWVNFWRNCLKSDCGFIFGFLVDFGKIIHFCWIILFD